MISKDNPGLASQTSAGILADIWEALRKEDSIRSLDLDNLSIDVKGGEVYLNGYLSQGNNLPRIVSIIYSVTGVLEVHNHLRTDDGILADIWDALWREDNIRSLDLVSLSIEVNAGEVSLYGYLAQENNLPLIESIVRSVAGVVAVHSHMVLDRDLIIRVAQALAGDERIRPYILPVDAFHGWIHIGGEVPTYELQHAVEKIAAGVSGVCGVISLPRVAGQSPEEPRRAMQPRIGAVVYGKNGVEGTITQVVIQPDNRLVTHIVVSSKELIDGNLEARETVIPLEASDLVKNESTFLVRIGPSLKTYPYLDPDEFPLAPFTWKAPYPYTAGEVRWSLPENLEAGSRSSQPETKPGREIQGAAEQVMAQAGA